jgi:predicted glycoside hydrolase/deacetylase ChbG (UPF0249 family)
VNSERFLIVNADDFGASTGVNRGIVECHVNGILTSASMMVTGAAASEAASLARENPDLSVGLHWDCWGEDEREFDLDDEQAIRDEFSRQLEAFYTLMGQPPTHVDTHRHAHRKWNGRLMPLFSELVEPLNVPLRDDGRVRFVGHFYAQWRWGVTELDRISVPALIRLLHEKVQPGWTEISCHPGYRSPGYRSIYLDEREVEVRTLTDPRVQSAVEEVGISLVGYDRWGGG